MKHIDTVIFDLGAVLIDWHPEHLFKKIIPNEGERKRFLDEVCSSDWNEEQDAGRSLAEGTEELVRRYPEKESLIRAYYGRWDEMLNGPIHTSVDVLREIKDSGKYKIYALTNWSAETFPIALQRFNFLHWFDGILMSGEEKTRKPHKGFYQKLISKFGIDPTRSVFIDDNARNLPPAVELGMSVVHFRDADQFRQDMRKLQIIN